MRCVKEGEQVTGEKRSIGEREMRRSRGGKGREGRKRGGKGRQGGEGRGRRSEQKQG